LSCKRDFRQTLIAALFRADRVYNFRIVCPGSIPASLHPADGNSYNDSGAGAVSGRMFRTWLYY